MIARRRTPTAVLLAAVLLVGATIASAGFRTDRADAATAAYGPAHSLPCATAPAGHARCFAEIRVRRPGASVTAADAAPPPGALRPGDIADAYGLVGAPRGGDATVAVVDAYSDPDAAADLAVYRKAYGLPACDVASGCLKIVDQRGATNRTPPADPNWAVEISLDLDAVSAACPACKVLLVQADSDAATDLAASENTAVRLGATVVSNSFGTPEYTGMAALAASYRHPGVTIVASSDDAGFGPPTPFPAVLSNVIAVGGTTLTRAAATVRGWTESAWAGAGSGCSAYVTKPSWQHDGHCAMRTVADIAAVADPNSGFALYDTFELGDQAGFIFAGGTSLSAPLIAAMIARSGRPLDDARRIYAHRADLYDPIGGSNGFCGKDYLCTGKRGYDGPTGNGSPRGLGAL